MLTNEQTQNEQTQSAWRGVVCLFILLLLSPLLLVGFLGFLVRLRLINIPQGISGTAYEPFWGRAMGHAMGARRDPTSYRLAKALPATSPFIATLVLEPARLAARISGYAPPMLGGELTHPVSIMSMMSLRQAFFDTAIDKAKSTVEQIVILGSAWDTRAYEQLRDWGHPVFEVDMPPTIRAKIEALDKVGIDRSHVTFVETDFNQTTWLQALQEHGFDPGRPTFVLWEGVTMYLPEDAVMATFEQVAGLAPGSRIAFDYFSREFFDGNGAYRFIAPLVKRSLKLTYSETFVFGIPMQPIARDAAATYLKTSGLTLTDFDMTGADGKLTGVYAFAVAKVGESSP